MDVFACIEKNLDLVQVGKSRKILAESHNSKGKYLSTDYFCGPEACFRLELTAGAGAWASAVSMVW